MRNLRTGSDAGFVLSHLLLVLILVTGSMPLLDMAVRPSSEGGPAFSLNICHPAQALDAAAALIPLAIPSRAVHRSPSPAFAAPRTFQVHLITDYIPDVIPPPPK
ncbi:MAG TPA: hypothetical protein VMU41_01485 [Candidatus Binataceae bacterium]|nr:hypothetical protein [Candidatus Binataceae bacterium]